MNYRLRWFASLADQAGCESENASSTAATPESLYQELALRHGFTLTVARLRVAVNGRFVGWQEPLTDDDEIVFVPPVSGG